MRIANIINTLAGGGAERVSIGVYNCLKKFHYHQEFIIAKNIIDYKIDFEPKILFNIKKKPIYMPAFWYENRLLKKLENTLKGFDITISHLRDMNTRLCFLKSQNRLNSKLMIVEHVRKFSYSKKEIDLISNLYKYADVCVGVSNEVVSDLQSYGAKNTILIENFVDIENIKFLARKENIKLEGFSFLSMGRLSEDKDFETLIKAFKMANLKDGKLYILGEGSKKQKLETLIRNLNLSESIALLGFKENPFVYIKACSCYITSSIRESFSLATLEAMALGKPIISTNIIPFAKDFENALTIPIKNPQKMAEAMIKIYNDKQLREKLSKNAVETAKIYSFDNFCNKYILAVKNL